MPFPYGETVTRLRDGVKINRHGNEVPDPTNPSRYDFHGVGVEPRPLPEANQDARNAVASGHSLYFREAADFTEHDQVEVRGEVERVDGRPATWRNPLTGAGPYTVIQTKRTEG